MPKIDALGAQFESLLKAAISKCSWNAAGANLSGLSGDYEPSELLLLACYKE